ncbi:MAG TPA: hypothetical protein VN577_10185 [Terriglobales bacterium]|nr:hypothetical protein [Terriglobales bacterium]
MNKKSIEAVRLEFDRTLARYIKENPAEPYKSIATKFEIGIDWVIRVAKANGITRPRGRKPRLAA